MDKLQSLVAQTALLAQASLNIIPQIKEVLNILMAFGFLFGTVLIIGGAMDIRRGDTEAGKMKIIGGALIAGAPTIMRVLFEIFGNTVSM